MPDLSLLLPVYECPCVELVEELHRQCTALHIDFEIIVADDGSPDRRFQEQNKAIERLPHTRYIVRRENVGRSAIRNFLAREAKAPRLVFVDGDMKLHNPTFVATYLDCPRGKVVYGGYSIGPLSNPEEKGNLRRRYEEAFSANHRADVRNRHPYHDFHTSNFLVDRSVMMETPLDENFHHYGYEDILWGKQLQGHGIEITHIDNPVSFDDFEDNAHFLRKTEESLRTLKLFSHELHGYSALLGKYRIIKRLNMGKMVNFFYKSVRKPMLTHLEGNNPRVFVFNIYKLLYYNHINQEKE